MRQLPLYLLTFFILFGFAELHAQSTKGFNYQAVARDNSGATLDNTSVNLRFQIRDGSPNGTLLYQEKHTPTTNSFGLLATQIGKGNAEVGDFSTINWADSDLYLLVELNGNGVDTTLLEAVPYAKVATDMRLEDLKDVNSPAPSPNQVLSWDGSAWVPADVASTTYTAGNGINITGSTISNNAPDQTVSLSGSGATAVSGTYPNFTISSTDNVNDADADPNNEMQNLTLSGNSLSISNGNSVALPTGTTYTAGNGISLSGNAITNSEPDQTVSISGTGATSVSGTYPNFTINSTDNVNDADADPNNEMQSLTLSGNSLSISNGNSVALPTGTTYTAGNGISLSGNAITNSEPDQTVSISGTGATSVSGTYPNFTINSTDNVNDADASTTNEVQSMSLSGNTLSLSLGGGSVSLASFASPWNNSGSNLFFSTGKVGIGDNSPIATLTVGNGDKLQIHGAEGDVIFNDDQGSLRFANANGPNQPMIQMFPSGTNNSTRMFLAHSPSFPNWGIQYSDTSDAFTWIGDGLPVLNVGLSGAQRVGIGTFSPEARLHIESNSNLGNSQLKLVERGFDYARISLENDIHSNHWDLAARTDTNLANAQFNIFHSDAGDLFSVNARGRVGINDPSPSYALEINGNQSTRVINAYNSLPTTTNTTYNYGLRVSLSQANNTGFPRLYNVYGISTDSDAYLTYGLYGYASGASSNNYGVYAYAPTTSGYAGYFNGNVYATGSYLPSDVRLKSDIQPLGQGLQALMQLQPKQYQYKREEFDFMNLPEGQQYGFLAQDIQTLLPELTQKAFQAYDEALSDTPEGQGFEFTAVNYIGLIPIVVSAMQEQQDIIATQNAKIESLEARLAALEALIKQ